MSLLVQVLLPLAILQGDIDLTGFASILFLFLGLTQIAVAVGVSLAVLIVVLQLIGIDVLGIGKTLFGRD